MLRPHAKVTGTAVPLLLLLPGFHRRRGGGLAVAANNTCHSGSTIDARLSAACSWRADRDPFRSSMAGGVQASKLRLHRASWAGHREDDRGRDRSVGFADHGHQLSRRQRHAPAGRALLVCSPSAAHRKLVQSTRLSGAADLCICGDGSPRSSTVLSLARRSVLRVAPRLTREVRHSQMGSSKKAYHMGIVSGTAYARRPPRWP